MNNAFILLDKRPPSRVLRGHIGGNISAVAASLAEDRDLSISRRSQQLRWCNSKIQDSKQESWF